MQREMCPTRVLSPKLGVARKICEEARIKFCAALAFATSWDAIVKRLGKMYLMASPHRCTFAFSNVRRVATRYERRARIREFLL